MPYMNEIRNYGDFETLFFERRYRKSSSYFQLAVSNVVHKSFVSVDEHGSEAAAATAIGLGGAGAPSQKPPIIFKADHPFLFAIVYNDEILFFGRYAG